MNLHKDDILQIAFNKSKEKLVSVYDVKTDRDCECFCPACGEPLEAKNKGKSKNEILMPGQKMAKEVLKRTKTLLLPSLYHKMIKLTDDKLIIFDEADLEVTIDNIRPDAKLVKNNKVLLIEFLKTHKVDPFKTEKIKKLNLSCLEIDLNGVEPLVGGEINYEGMQDLLENDAYTKEWIHSIELDRLYVKKEKELAEIQKVAKQKEQRLKQNQFEASKKEREAEQLEKLRKQNKIKDYNLKGFEQVKIYGRFENHFDRRHVFCPALKRQGEGHYKVMMRKCDICPSHFEIIETDYAQQLVICGFKGQFKNEDHF